MRQYRHMALPNKKQLEIILTPEGLETAIHAVGIDIATLAQEAGINRSSLYRYLGNENALSNRKLGAVWNALLKLKKK